MVNKKAIRIYPADDERLTGVIKDRFIKDSPELEGIPLSRAYLMKKVLDFVEENTD